VFENPSLNSFLIHLESVWRIIDYLLTIFMSFLAEAYVLCEIIQNGPNNMTPFNWGVNYRALHDLFHLTQSRLDVFHYEIGVQMLEIYNEQVRDLLNTDGVQRKLEIRNSSQLNGSNVPDASMMTVRSTEDVLELMKVGQKNRAVGATALNDRSSRSHRYILYWIC
jgi:hypothetical protein